MPSRAACSQGIQRPATNQLTVFDDADSIRKFLGHVERMRGKEYRCAAIGLGAQQVFQEPNALGIEADGRLVDDQDFWLMNQSRSENRSLTHAVRIAFGQIVYEFLQVE